MRKQLSIILLFLAVYNLQSSSIISLPYITSDMVYSAKHEKLYAVIDAMDIEYGNRLVEINISTGVIERFLFVGSQPARIRLTSDENYAWISFNAIPFIKRIDLESFAIDKKIYLGPSQDSGDIEGNSQILCYNFTVFPNEDNKLAMALKTSFLFASEGIVLYRNDTIQPARIQPYTDTDHIPYCIEPVLNSSYLVGHNQSSTVSVFTTMKVVNNGLEMQDEFEGLIETDGHDIRNWIKVHHDTLYVAEGIVIDANDITDLRVTGKCENDLIGDLYGFTFSEIHDAYVYPNMNNDSLYLTFYDRESYEAFDSVFLMVYQFSQEMMITKLEVIDKYRFAILIGRDFGDFSIRIFDTYGMGVEEEPVKGRFEIYPNPVSDKLYIKGLPEHKTIYIYDMTGRLVNYWEINCLTGEIPLNDIQPGTYMLKIPDPENNSPALLTKIIVK
jgi:hypothetical protein